MSCLLFFLLNKSICMMSTRAVYLFLVCDHATRKKAIILKILLIVGFLSLSLLLFQLFFLYFIFFSENLSESVTFRRTLSVHIFKSHFVQFIIFKKYIINTIIWFHFFYLKTTSAEIISCFSFISLDAKCNKNSITYWTEWLKVWNIT